MSISSITYRARNIEAIINWISQFPWDQYPHRAFIVPEEAAQHAMKCAFTRWRKHTGNTSKYLPHQGKRECARRAAA